MFRRMVIGHAMHVVTMATWKVVTSLKIQVKIGFWGQKNSAGALLEPSTAMSVLSFENIERPSYMVGYSNQS